MKKRMISLLLVMSLALLSLFGCSKGDNKESENKESENKEAVVIRIGALKGPTTMGLAKLFSDSDKGESKVKLSYEIAAAGDELSPKLIKGELDMAAVPANMASIVYNKTEGQVSVLAINTLGVIYIVSTGDSVSSVADLKNKTIIATGEGATPEYSLRRILANNGIDFDKDVTVEWKSEATEVVAAMKQAEGEVIAMLPQPFVTVASTQIEGLKTVLSLNDEWDGADGKLVTGVIVVRNEFLKEHPDTVAAFLDEYKASTEYVNTNIDDAANMIEALDIVKAQIAKKAIPYCNITFIEGQEMKNALSSYLNTLNEINPKSIGGKLPGDDFYYAR